MNNCLTVTGEVTLELYDENKELKDKRQVSNIVVNGGLAHIAKRLVTADSPAEMAYMALGLGAAGPTDGTKVTLVSEVANSRSEAARDSSVAGKVTYSKTFGPDVGTGALVEAGIFNNAAYNTTTMLCRTVFATIDKAAADTLSISWSITINAPA